MGISYRCHFVFSVCFKTQQTLVVYGNSCKFSAVYSIYYFSFNGCWRTFCRRTSSVYVRNSRFGICQISSFAIRNRIINFSCVIQFSHWFFHVFYSRKFQTITIKISWNLPSEISRKFLIFANLIN